MSNVDTNADCVIIWLRFILSVVQYAKIVMTISKKEYFPFLSN